MDTIRDSSAEQPGTASRPERRWLSAAAMVVAGLLLGATGIAVASDTASTTATPTTGATAEDDEATKEEREAKAKARAERKAQAKVNGRGNGNGRGKAHGPNGGKHLLRGGPNGALHGEFVVRAADGKFETLVVQSGTVTAVSAKSITLKSEDGFTRTYAITADTRVKARGGGIAATAKGNNARVSAIKQDASLRAQLVHARPAPGQGMTKPKPKPSPTSSGAAT